MAHLQLRIFRAILVSAVFCSLNLSASSSWAAGADAKNLTAWHWQKPQGVCFDTTQVMRKACLADNIDNLYEESAKCLNTDEPRNCRREAFEDYRDGFGECAVQAAGRDDLCRRLPDAGPYITDIDPDDFKSPEQTQANGNKWFPLVIGTVTTFRNEEENEDIVVTVTDETREIEGVTTIVVKDVVSIDGEVIEDTDDYYAEDWDGTVWYFGEIARNFEDGFLADLDGSFIAGENGAQAGIIMLANPMVGDVYRQEFALGDAEDAAEVLALNGDVEIGNPDFACNNACLMTDDFIASDPDASELKYFKEGIGFVAEQLPTGEVVLELVSITPPAP